MFTFIVLFINHVCIYRVAVFIVVIWITCRAVGSLRNIHQMGGTFPFHANLLIMSFYGTVPTHFLQCFTMLSFWRLPLPHLQQMSVGNGTFLPFPLDLDGFPVLPLFPLLPLFAELWNFPLDFSFPFLDPFSY